MKKPFSKKLLAFDYIIMVILLAIFVACAIVNGLYIQNISQEVLQNGMDISMITVPFDISTLSIIVGTWAAQLGVSSSAYYILIRSDHKIEYPIRFLEELPGDVKETVDMTSIITTILSTTGN